MYEVARFVLGKLDHFITAPIFVEGGPKLVGYRKGFIFAVVGCAKNGYLKPRAMPVQVCAHSFFLEPNNLKIELGLCLG